MSQDSQFLKWKMEQIWLQRGCINPNHLNRWFTYERGYRVYSKTHDMVLLWVDKGTRMTSRRGHKPKGKGFSFLTKGYGLESRTRFT
jgi:hypothetical protein